MDELTHYMEACSRLRERAEQAERALAEATGPTVRTIEEMLTLRDERDAARLALAESEKQKEAWSHSSSKRIQEERDRLVLERDAAKRALAQTKEQMLRVGDGRNKAERERDTARRDLATRNEDALMWQREYDRLFVELADARRALAEKEAECERVRGTLGEWLRNMEAPVIRAFGQERWNAARQTIFDEGNASWTMILRVAAETIAADLAKAHAAMLALRTYPSRNCWGRYGCTDDQHDDLCLKARAILTGIARGPGCPCVSCSPASGATG